MTYDWYKIFSLSEFEDSGLISQDLSYYFEDLGIKEILVTKANTVGVTFEGVFLPIEFLGENPYAKDGYAVYKDTSNNVWIGKEVEE